MDAPQIEKMKALALAATPGPWQWWSSNSVKRVTGADGRDGGVLHAYSFRDGADIACSPSDQAFIAAANPAAVLELIAEVERLRAEVERLENGMEIAVKGLKNIAAVEARTAPASGTEKDAERLADGYESGFFASDLKDGDGQFTLHYRTAVQAEAAYMLVTGIIDAAIAARTKAGEPA